MKSKLLLSFIAGVIVTLLVVNFFEILSKVTEEESKAESELSYSTECLDSPFYGELVRYNDELYYDDATMILYFWDGKSPRHEATPCYSWNGLPYRLNSDSWSIWPATLMYEVEDAVREVVKEVIAEEKEQQGDVLK